MTEANNCCGTTCDKAKLKADQSRVVDAFDKFMLLDGSSEVEIGNAVARLAKAIAYLREKQ